jgi:hypothetical protein
MCERVYGGLEGIGRVLHADDMMRGIAEGVVAVFGLRRLTYNAGSAIGAAIYAFTP